MARKKAAATIVETAEAGVQGREILELDPESVLIDPTLRSMRNWSENSPHVQAIPDLARMIAREGQNTPAIVRYTDQGLMLVAGQRRLEAVKWARENITSAADLQLLVMIDPEILNESQARCAALAENIHRHGFNDLEFAGQCQLLRKEFGWGGEKGTKALADFLGVSPATVTQKEKLLGLAPELRQEILAGRMSGDAALQLLASAKPEKVREVAAKASEIAEEEALDEEVAQRLSEGDDDDTGDTDPFPIEPGKGAGTEAGAGRKKKAPRKRVTVEMVRKPTPEMKAIAKRARESVKREKAEAAERAKAAGLPEPKPVPVTGKHVRQAVKTVAGAEKEGAKPKAWRMSDAIAFFDALDREQYPDLLIDFADVFARVAHGKASEGKLQTAWEDLADALARGAKGKGKGSTKPKVKAKAKVPAKKKAAPAKAKVKGKKKAAKK